jgi:hypothetical protein
MATATHPHDLRLQIEQLEMVLAEEIKRVETAESAARPS